MSMPGWYPDPAGNAGHFRYWDGQAWSSQTTTDPTQTPPPAALAPDGPQRDRESRWPLLLALVGVLVMALLIWAVFFRGGNQPMAVEDTNSASPTGPVWNEKDTPTPTPSGTDPAPTGGAGVSCPTDGGNVVPASGSTLTSGGLSVDRIDGWDHQPSFELAAIRDVQVQLLLVYQGPLEGWLSGQIVGRLAQGDGFKDPRTAAGQIMDCYATSAYYRNFTGRTDVIDEAITIDGHKGWRLTTDIRVDSPGLPGIPGDRMDIVVLDTGQGDSLAIWSGWATIGDSERQARIDEARSTLRVG